MNKLLNTIEKKQNSKGKTFNGAKTNISSLNACVDLFGNIGSMRARTVEDVIVAFTKAFAEDPLKAMRILFWARDVRGGAGERRVFRVILRYLATHHEAAVLKNLHLLQEYGRWDDILVLLDTPVKKQALEVIADQFNKDKDSDTPSIFAKWAPSINTSSEKTRTLAKTICAHLKISERQYRKTLKNLRGKINVLEKTLCQGDWDKINFEHVPSNASLKYRKAFFKKQTERYKEFLSQIEKGEKTIKASTLYPYDIVRAVSGSKEDRTLDAQWNALPNYVEPFNGLVVCDTSGSMGSMDYYYGGETKNVSPLHVAISLSIYIAERNSGEWENKFITFSSTPVLQTIKGTTISEKCRNLAKANWSMSTDLIKVFDLILKTATANKLSEDEMPKMVMIISDMAFNSACDSNKRTNFEQIEKKYQKHGYKRPQLVFWNVNASGKDSPIVVSDEGTCLVSGCSPAILKSVLSQEVITPSMVMDQTINSDRYSLITI